MNNTSIARFAAGLVIAALAVMGCSAQQPDTSSATKQPGSNGIRPVASANDGISTSRQNAITRAARLAAPAIVGINVTEVREYTYADPFGNDPFFQFFHRHRMQPQTFQQEVRGLGSGFLISPDGYIVTNDHVAGNASKIIVTTVGGTQYDATIVGSDPTSDIALLKIDGRGLPFLELGNSDDAIVGEWAIALGNPFGLFDINSKPTITVGVISNTGVNLQPTDQRVYRGMLQTDAAISSGNSGGPLLNALGQVIGVNATIYTTANSRMGAGSIGIGFAIPINRVRLVVEELKKKGSVDRNYWTGMTIQTVDDRIARYLKLDETDGVVVSNVVPGSPADKAGLQTGDVIRRINGAPIHTEENALLYLYDGRVGDTMSLDFSREGKSANTTLTLDRRPNGQ